MEGSRRASVWMNRTCAILSADEFLRFPGQFPEPGRGDPKWRVLVARGTPLHKRGKKRGHRWQTGVWGSGTQAPLAWELPIFVPLSSPRPGEAENCPSPPGRRDGPSRFRTCGKPDSARAESPLRPPPLGSPRHRSHWASLFSPTSPGRGGTHRPTPQQPRLPFAPEGAPRPCAANALSFSPFV